jgi:microcystin-dependent protein
MSEPFIGEIRIVAFDYAPRGFAFCEGQLLQISQHQALFSLLGTTYGGDGRTTFALPDLKESFPQKTRERTAQTRKQRQKGIRYVIALEGLFPSRT